MDLFDEDTEADTRGEFESALDEGLPPPQAADRVLAVMADDLEDIDDRPRVMIALAALLLDCGVREHPVFREAREAIRIGRHRELWMTEELRQQRRALEEQLATRLPSTGGNRLAPPFLCG